MILANLKSQLPLTLLFIALSINVSSCASGIMEIENAQDKIIDSHSLSYNNVENLVLMLHNVDTKTLTKSDDYKIEPISYNGLDAVAYVAQFNDSWELVANDRRVQPIIMRGEGKFSFDDLNPTARYWLDSEMQMLCDLKKQDDLQVNNSHTEFWEAIAPSVVPACKSGNPYDSWQGWKRIGSAIEYNASTLNIPHIISTKWGQGWPWNECAPYATASYSFRCAQSCAVVAYAQILYWLYANADNPIPEYSYGYCDGISNIAHPNDYTMYFDENSLSTSVWSQMALDALDNMHSHQYVAVLMAHLGEVLHEEYNKYGSAYATSQDDIHGSQVSDANFISNDVGNAFGIVYHKLTSQFTDEVCSNLLNGIPSIVKGESYGAADKHAWIIDGLLRNTHNITTYFIYDPYDTYDPENQSSQTEEDPDEEEGGSLHIPAGYLVRTTETPYTESFYRMNWGHDGDGDSHLCAVDGDWVFISDYGDDTTDYCLNHKVITGFEISN